MFLLDIKVEDTWGVARYKGLTGCSRQVLCQEQETPPPQKPRCLVVSWKPTGAQEWLAELGEFLWNFTNFEFKDSEQKSINYLGAAQPPSSHSRSLFQPVAIAKSTGESGNVCSAPKRTRRRRGKNSQWFNWDLHPQDIPIRGSAPVMMNCNPVSMGYTETNQVI